MHLLMFGSFLIIYSKIILKKSSSHVTSRYSTVSELYLKYKHFDTNIDLLRLYFCLKLSHLSKFSQDVLIETFKTIKAFILQHIYYVLFGKGENNILFDRSNCFIFG